MNNRLQFRHHNEVFATREAAIEYIQSQIRFAEEGLAADDKRLGYSLLAEPTILRYVNEEDETNPHIILTIGSVTNEGTQYSENKFCIIDIDKTEQEIADLEEALIAAIKSLTVITKDTDTLKLYAEKTEEGTYVSGDVKVAESHIFDDVREYNNIMVTPEGIFLYVNLTYDENTEIFTFTVNNADGTLSETSVKLPNNYVTSGYYSVQDQSIHLRMRESDEVVIDCKYLISEWDVEGDEAKSPIYLTKEEVDFDVDDNSRLKPWQDVLRADVRIKDESFDPATGKPVYDPESVNILRRTQDKKYLFVDGKASNIVYYMDGQKSNVKEALDKLGKIKLSSDYSNILQEKTDGFFASAKLNYISKENTLVFKVSNQDETRIKLNSFRLFENVYYDSTKEALIITYIDGNDELQIVEIPIGQMISEWEVYNEGHTVQLDKSRSIEGKDILTADVKIFQGHNNILTETNHTMYVRGEADNIKYLPTGNTTVKDVLDELKAEDARIDSKLDDEIARAEGEEQRIDAKLDQEIADRIADVDEEQARAEAAEEVLTDKIGTGFTTDPHDNVTYKFETLQAQVNSEAEKLQAEIERSEAKDTEHDGRLNAIDAEIGEGFGPRNTVRDEIDNLQSEIDSVSADASMRLTNVINEDESIDVETRDDVNGKPTIKVVKVNLSSEVEDNKPNIIKLNADGLYVGVDLIYNFDPEVGTNQLIFKTTDATKTIDLKTQSVVDKIYYDPSREAIIIEYTVDGHRMPDVVVPIGDLIREWQPSENTDGAIKLTLTEAPSGTTGKDILYGEVLISDHEGNILVNNGGRLYVSNSEITANTAAISALENRMDTAESDIDALENNLREEITARTLADDALGRRIDQEIADRTQAVTDEETRATIAETALQTAINDETTRATGEELRIEHLLSDEVARSTAKDNDQDIAIANNENAIVDEVTRAKNAENVISGNVITEETRAKAAEASLNNAINSEVSRAQGVETALQTALQTERDARAEADRDLNTAITNESNTRLTEDTRIEEKLDNEISRSIAEDQELHDRIDAERERSIIADTQLNGLIETEVARSKGEEVRLEGLINHETTRATGEEIRIEQKLDNEISRSTTEDSRLNDAITAETQARINADEALGHRIDDVTYTVDDTSTIDLTLSEKKISGVVVIQEGDNLIKTGSGGLYATANLAYDSARNTIWLETSNGSQTPIQLNTVGSLIDSIVYDAANRKLVITYHDGAGNTHTIDIPVGQLFNDWTVKDPSSNSAIHLEKRIVTGDSPDELSAYAIISPLADNALTIDSNGLYVSSEIMNGAMQKAKCVGNEVKVIEKQIFGAEVSEECGSGFTYAPLAGVEYITTATSLNHADYLLDRAIKSASSYTEAVEDNLEIVSSKTECNTSEILTLENNYLGITIDHSINPCGAGTRYEPSEGTKYISGATTFKQADAILDTAIKETADRVTINEFNIGQLSGHVNDLQTEVDNIELGAGLNTDGTYQPSLDGRYISGATSLKNADELLNNTLEDLRDDLDELMIGSDTVSTHMWIEKVYNNKHLKADVRLSRGNTELEGQGMTAEDMFIKDFTGQTIEAGQPEFTDTNVLRIVDTTEYNPAYRYDSKWHGVYLSNEWNCGKYYGPAESSEVSTMVEQGYEVYNTNYKTDEAGDASGYNYMNNVRQPDRLC